VPLLGRPREHHTVRAGHTQAIFRGRPRPGEVGSFFLAGQVPPPASRARVGTSGHTARPVVPVVVDGGQCEFGADAVLEPALATASGSGRTRWTRGVPAGTGVLSAHGGFLFLQRCRWRHRLFVVWKER